ncbi:Purine-cytosine permease fcyB [Lachnellula suecica]|uniref:Purine-cytosine permease fcyB n=1 Tax=Lachnellula suecica TaxID=602035 RepID=A0A8T9C9Y9_9HELO|nr:Purine-cytosine permease fcyB [Lachnellula suecica]
MAPSEEMTDAEKGFEDLQADRRPLADLPNESAANEPISLDHAPLHANKPEPPIKYLAWAHRVEDLLGFEARGIQQVKRNEQTERTTLGFVQIVMMWLSINTASQNVTLASIGQSVFGLGFVDATLCSVFGAIVGTIPVAYAAGWGPWSGNRTMVCARFSMGWWPVKLCVLFNLVILIGYSMIDAVIAGQILSAVSPNGSLTVSVGIVITAILTVLVTTLGIKFFHYYERYAWIPSIAVFLILAGTAGPHFDTHSASTVEGRTLIGNRLSFFSVCLSSAITYAPGAADFLVYCDPKVATRWKVFAATMTGLTLTFTFTFVIGAGLSSGIANNPSWAAAGAGSGALVVAGFDGLGGFGKFCSVMCALGLIANMVAPIYSSGIDWQILGRYPAVVPRFLWNILGVIIFTVCALAGKDHLSEIFTNFLALMGYWVVMWIVITLEEEFIFRRRMKPTLVWSDWNSQDKLPIGLAAMAAFCVGWVGAVLCMAQVYFIGPLAKLVGDYGADMGNYVGFAWAGLVYLPLRYLELKKFGR